MAGRYQAYPEYKDSEVEWLEAIPRHWGVKKLKFLAKVQPSNVDKKTKVGELPVVLCNYTDVYYNDTIDSSMDFMKASATEDQIDKFTLRAGDAIITKDSEDPNDIAISTYVPEDIDGVVCGYHLAMIRPNGMEHSAYIKRVFESGYARAYFATRANGLTRYGLGTYALENIFYPKPPGKEALAIANFLDHETAKIDSLIEKQQQLIKLLKEKRQAVISHAVTKGLTPQAPMKDSGVEWLGEVPAHWDFKALRFLGTCQNGINISAELFGSGFPFLSYGDVYKNEALPEEVTGLVQSSELDRRSYSVSEGDVLFTRTSETIDEIGFASTCLKSIKEVAFAGFLIRFRPKENVLYPKFSKYFFRNELLRAFFIKEMNLVTRASLSQDLLKKLPVLLPSLEEQKEIAEYLDEKTAVFSKLMKNAEAAIELMQERRTALISAAVTGKIDVRNWHPPKQPQHHKEKAA